MVIIFTLLETRPAPAESAWTRWRRRWPGGRLETGPVAAMPYPRYLHARLEWPVSDNEDLRRRRLRLLCKQLLELGASGVVLPPGFPYPGDLHGLAVSTPVPLYRRLGSRLLLRLAEQRGLPRGRWTAALLSRHPSTLLTEAVHRVGQHAGTIKLWAGRDSEEYCYGLRKYGGMALLAQPAPSADLYLLLEPPAQPLHCPDHAVVLNFTGVHPDIRGGLIADAITLEPPASLDAVWPGGCDTAALLAALYATGQLPLDGIRMTGLQRGGRALSLGT